MPFYEYQCPHCGFDEEVLQSINDKPLKKCPSCGKSGIKKLVSAPVFRLKGSGWYETDFKSDQEKKRNLAGPDKEESGSESKPDAKAEAKPQGKDDTKSEAKPDKPKAAPVKAVRKPAKAKSRPTRKRR